MPPPAGPESEELAALYDRFLLRRRVTPVSDDGVLEMLLGVAGRAETGADEPGGCAIELPNLERTGLPNLEHPELTLRQVLEHVRAAAKSVELPRHVALLLRDARAFARDQGVDGQGGGYVSDRRLRRAAQVCLMTLMAPDDL